MEPKKLYRSKENRMVCGVCGGVAEYFNIDPTLIRLGVAVVACVSCGSVLVGYFLAAVIVPEEP